MIHNYSNLKYQYPTREELGCGSGRALRNTAIKSVNPPQPFATEKNNRKKPTKLGPQCRAAFCSGVLVWY